MSSVHYCVKLLQSLVKTPCILCGQIHMEVFVQNCQIINTCLEFLHSIGKEGYFLSSDCNAQWLNLWDCTFSLALTVTWPHSLSSLGGMCCNFSKPLSSPWTWDPRLLLLEALSYHCWTTVQCTVSLTPLKVSLTDSKHEGGFGCGRDGP